MKNINNTVKKNISNNVWNSVSNNVSNIIWNNFRNTVKDKTVGIKTYLELISALKSLKHYEN